MKKFPFSRYNSGSGDSRLYHRWLDRDDLDQVWVIEERDPEPVKLARVIEPLSQSVAGVSNWLGISYLEAFAEIAGLFPENAGLQTELETLLWRQLSDDGQENGAG